MEVKRKRGRPHTYGPAERAQLAELVRKYGITGARRTGQTLASSDTLAKVAREFGIQLVAGRRSRHAPEDAHDTVPKPP